jgi:two-component system OmpR family response regulator
VTAGSRRILVVDDDEAIRRLLSELLTAEGCETRAAAGGREALTILREWRPDLIVLDLMMPDLDGWSFLVAQRKPAGARAAPVLLLSAGTGLEAPETAAVGDVLVKPFELDEFLAAVNRLTGRAGRG